MDKKNINAIHMTSHYSPTQWCETIQVNHINIHSPTTQQMINNGLLILPSSQVDHCSTPLKQKKTTSQ
jgi:hypothetical protein